MSLQIEQSVENSVTIRATRKLGSWIIVVHLAKVIVVSQQSHSIFVFLHNLSGKFTDNVPIHIIYKIQQNVEILQIFNKGMSLRWTLSNWSVLNASNLLMNVLNKFEASSSSR